MKPQTTPIKSAENPIERLQNLKVNVKSNSNISVSFSCGFLEEKSLNDVREIALDFASLQTTAKEKEFCERLEKQIAILRTKANNCGDSTKEQRARKGAWVDAIVMFNELFKMYHPVCKHENITRSDGLDECLDCGARNY